MIPPVEIPESLLIPCNEPKQIPVGADLPFALQIVVENHGEFARCYNKHKRLINAVKTIGIGN